MKKLMRRLTAVILAAAVFATPTLNAMAAGNDAYVSEVAAVSAASYDEAKAALEAAGYQIVKGNLNGTLKTGVYLGYKTTAEADQAITDLAIMNMTGNYNYSDYQTILEKQKEVIRKNIGRIIPAIAEFQENYENGTQAALVAYDMLNLYKEDDCGMLIGDYLLAYDFSESAEDALVNAFMQGNSQIILAIETAVMTAADSGADTLTERLQELGPDGLVEKYVAAYPTLAKAMQAMAKEYDGTANEIKATWNDFYLLLQETEEKYVIKNDDGTIAMRTDAITYEETDKTGATEDETALLEGMDDLVESSVTVNAVANFAVYASLYSAEYGEGTLLDYFMRPVAEVTNAELYPFIDAMSEGQRAQVGFLGLRDTLLQAFADLDAEDETVEEELQNAADTAETLAEMESISIYSGVDRSIFGDGVAFTDKATQHERLTGKSWIEELMGGDNEKEAWMKSVIYASITTGVLTAMTASAAIVQYVLQRSANIALDYAQEIAKISKQAERLMSNVAHSTGRPLPQYFFDCSYRVQAKAKVAAGNVLEAKQMAREAGGAAKIVKWGCFALLVVAAAIDVYSIIQYFTTDDPQEEAIPHHIVTTAETAYGTDYIYYETVKDLEGNPADLNHHEADTTIGWLVLYETRDANAGDPITAKSLKVQTGSDAIDPDSAFAHMFNETAAANVTAKTWTGVEDAAKGTYILFEHAAAALTGSVFSSGAAAMIGGAGLIVGLAAGLAAMYLVSQRKKEKTA